MRRRFAGVRNAVLASVSLVLLIVAAILLLRASADRLPPEARLPVPFQCRACGARFELTPAQIESELPRVSQRGTPDGGGGGFRCRSCGVLQAFRADDSSGP